LLSEWTPSDESDDDDAVDVLLSDDEIEDDVADEMDLFLSDEDIVAARDSSDGDARLFEDDEEAAFVAATGFSSPVAEGEDNDDEAVMLSESDVVAEDESEDSFLNDVDLDSLLSEDPFADEEPAFLIGPAPAREPEPRAETADQAADDSAFLDDLDNEIQASSTESAGPKAMQDVDPFDDDDTGFVIGPASRNGHSNHAEAGTSADAPRDEEDESVAEVEVDALEGEIDIEAHEDEIDIEAHEDDDVGDVDEREGGEEDRSAQDETDSAGDIAAGFGGESETLDHLLNAAGLSRPVQPGPKAQPDGNFAASFGLTLRPTFGENGAEQDEDDANPRQRDEVRDFYSVPRAGE
jgi:hypothetical protein